MATPEPDEQPISTQHFYDGFLTACDPALGGGERRQLLMGLALDANGLATHVRRLEAQLCAFSKEIAELRADLGDARADAMTDPLTGLANRRAFTTALESAGGSSQLLLIDIDHFKRVNDEHGHAAGDEVLQIVAGLLRGNVRHQHLLARLGGDEFGLLLPLMRADDAAEVAFRLCDLLGGRALVLRGRSEVVKGVTLSIGVTERSDGEDGTAWYERTDKVLYRAKHHGRDRVSVGRQLVRESSSKAPGALISAFTTA